MFKSRHDNGSHFIPKPPKGKHSSKSTGSVESHGNRKLNSGLRDGEEESYSYSDVSDAEILRADPNNPDILYAWYGGESHYVHILIRDENGDLKEVDVFSGGFDKNELDKNYVNELIDRHIESERQE